jgi:deazaflavin-dependent oxidoreductase (nitroreductase family)
MVTRRDPDHTSPVGRSPGARRLKPPGRTLRRALRAPILLYRLRLGWILGHRFVCVVHRGRSSGQRREAVVEVVGYDRASRAVTVVSGWARHSQWYRNIRVEPALEIRVGGRRYEAPRQEFLTLEEGITLLGGYGRPTSTGRPLPGPHAADPYRRNQRAAPGRRGAATGRPVHPNTVTARPRVVPRRRWANPPYLACYLGTRGRTTPSTPQCRPGHRAPATDRCRSLRAHRLTRSTQPHGPPRRGPDRRRGVRGGRAWRR